MGRNAFIILYPIVASPLLYVAREFSVVREKIPQNKVLTCLLLYPVPQNWWKIQIKKLKNSKIGKMMTMSILHNFLLKLSNSWLRMQIGVCKVQYKNDSKMFLYKIIDTFFYSNFAEHNYICVLNNYIFYIK